MNTQPTHDELEAQIESAMALEVEQKLVEAAETVMQASTPPETRRSLIARSRDSLASNLTGLQREYERLINEVANANEAHRMFLKQAEQRIYEIRTVRAALEESHVKLMREGD